MSSDAKTKTVQGWKRRAAENGSFRVSINMTCTSEGHSACSRCQLPRTNRIKRQAALHLNGDGFTSLLLVAEDLEAALYDKPRPGSDALHDGKQDRRY